jgi:glycosyltransferase involved in cell wall biosynthesis
MLALPIDLDLSKMLIKNISYVLEESEVKFHVVIKPHPNYTEAGIRAICPDINAEFAFTEEDFNTTLEKSNLMITSLSTSAMESMAKGVPVVLACQNSELYKIPIPKSIQQEIWRMTTNPDEMLEAISELLSLDRKFIEEKSSSIRCNYFENISDLSVELLVCGYKGVQ